MDKWRTDTPDWIIRVRTRKSSLNPQDWINREKRPDALGNFFRTVGG